jgi:hypothetical protein
MGGRVPREAARGIAPCEDPQGAAFGLYQPAAGG